MRPPRLQPHRVGLQGRRDSTHGWCQCRRHKLGMPRPHLVSSNLVADPKPETLNPKPIVHGVSVFLTREVSLSRFCVEQWTAKVKPTYIGCNCTVQKTCIWGCAYWGSSDLHCHASSLEYLRPGRILQCAEGKAPKKLEAKMYNWVC